MNLSLCRLALALILLPGLPAQAQTYNVVDLNNSPFTSTQGLGVSGSTQIGAGVLNGQNQALLWDNSAASLTNLTPSGYTSTYAYSVANGATSGYGVTSVGKTVALLWTGPAASSARNINPTVGGVPLALSVATAISANSIVGYGQTTASPFALLWGPSLTTATNLNPTGYSSSEAYGVYNNAQVGYAIASTGSSHAMLWIGTAASAVDLHPSAFQQSFATGIYANAIVGYAVPSIGTSNAQAYMWFGSAASGTSLNPPGYLNSFALAINGPHQVGYGTNGSGQQVALFWNGSASSAVNLSAFLPAGVTNAQARSIDSSGNIVGFATVNGQTHAFLWQPTTPPLFSSMPQTATTALGLSYSYTVKAQGTPTPTFSITAGSLPPGLSFSSTTGLISGKPTLVGAYSATITASNGTLPNANQTFSLTVVNPPSMQLVTQGSCVTADGFLFEGFAQATDGTFYGVTVDGGAGTSGTLVALNSSGTESLVHSFADGSVMSDGKNPEGVTAGPGGAVYGITNAGGSSSDGTVFEYNQGVTTILHNFQDGTVGSDGSLPEAPLIQGRDGNFYGVTVSGGAGFGTIFQITPLGAVTILHKFNDGSTASDGTTPLAALMQASDGNFYGTTYGGGPNHIGTVFKMTPDGTVTTLHVFGVGNANDGADPTAPLVEGYDGNLYGTTQFGGMIGDGTIFKITKQGAVTILRNLGDGTVGSDAVNSGGTPSGGLILGPDGNFYGLSTQGGSAGKGTLYQVTPQGAMLVLHSFGDGSVSNDGASPASSLILSPDGNFYGLASSGGASGGGALFKFSLQSAPVFSSSPTLTNASAGSIYSFTFTAFGSPAPTFTLGSGTLPPGLTLSSSGVLSGIPTQAGTYSATITASNGFGTAASQTFTLTIADSATDTPTMPLVDLIILATLLLAIAAKFLPKHAPHPFTSPPDTLI